ncbi:MAG: Rrf2 family transcriptional regulator [Planctomycetaceae bacterium]|jgi:Rrf2 family protein|nr:Rrf2 family transcriptional regulator [Planctomycetaceae bacterium]
MKVSAKTEYACIAVMELAANYGSPEPVRIRNIAERHFVPPRFLVQILLQLKGAGIVSSTRGAAGGYNLIPRPEEVTLGQVMGIIDGPAQIPKPSRAFDPSTESHASRVLNDVWEIAEYKRQDYLNNITFADLVKRCYPERGNGESVSSVNTDAHSSQEINLIPTANCMPNHVTPDISSSLSSAHQQ